MSFIPKKLILPAILTMSVFAGLGTKYFVLAKDHSANVSNTQKPDSQTTSDTIVPSLQPPTSQTTEKPSDEVYTDSPSINDLKNQISSTKTDLENKKTELSNKQRSITSLNTKVDQMKKECEKLKQGDSTYSFSAAKISLTDYIKELLSSVEGDIKNLDQYSKDLDNSSLTKTSFDKTKNDYEDLKKNRENKDKEIEDFNKNIQEHVDSTDAVVSVSTDKCTWLNTILLNKKMTDSQA